MKKILYTCMVIIVLLTACSAPTQIPELSTALGDDHTHGVYEFNFSVERISGWTFEEWDFVYTYNGEEIKGGHQIFFSPEIFSFHSVQVDVTERDAPNNTYSAAFPVAICDGGSGKTEITVNDSDGHAATFQITCQITRIGKQYDHGCHGCGRKCGYFQTHGRVAKYRNLSF